MGLFTTAAINAFPLDAGQPTAAVPLTKVFEYALFFGDVELFTPIFKPPRGHFDVFKDNRFAWELNQQYGKDVGPPTEFDAIFDELVQSGTVRCVPIRSPIIEIEKLAGDGDVSDFSVRVLLPDAGFDPFGHPFVGDDLRPFALPPLEPLKWYGQALMAHLATRLSSETEFERQIHPGGDEFELELQPPAEGRFRVRTNILARRVDRGIYHRDEYTQDEEAHIYQIYYMVSELLRVALMAKSQTDVISPSLTRREVSFRAWEPDDTPPNTAAERQIGQFFDFRAGHHPDIRGGLAQGLLQAKGLRRIFEAAPKWKQWIQQIGDDKQLASEYLAAIEKEPVMNRLPVKSLRWGALTGLGLAALLVNPAMGAAVAVASAVAGTVDFFLLERAVEEYNPKIFWSKVGKEIQKDGRR